ITIPLKNGEGGFVADRRTLDELEGEGRVALRYEGVNPNGTPNDIAAVTDAAAAAVGLMPHPEHAVETGFGPDSDSGSGTDGLAMFTSVLGVLITARPLHTLATATTESPGPTESPPLAEKIGRASSRT